MYLCFHLCKHLRFHLWQHLRRLVRLPAHRHRHVLGGLLRLESLLMGQ